MTTHCHLSVQQSLPFDIALVTPESAVYAAAQHPRRNTPWVPAEYEPLVERAEVLAKRAKEGTVALFLGAGVTTRGAADVERPRRGAEQGPAA